MNPEYASNLVNRRDLKPYLNADQFEFRDSVNRVLTRHASPEYVRQCDEEKRFPQELVKVAAEQGWFGITLPEAYGGVGGYLDMAAYLEVVAYHTIALARFWNANVNMVGGALARFATDEIKTLVLPKLAEGRAFLAFALSENGSGSDAASLTTRGVADGNDFVLDGTKMWISGALQADYILTAVRTNPEAKKHDGISLFLVPKESRGLTINPIDLLGGHAIRTCEVVYDGVRVPKDMIVGGLHVGWKKLTTVLSKERIALSAMCVGGAQAAIDLARWYANDRKQFGQSIIDFQAVSHLLADMQTRVDAARLMAFRAAKLLDEGDSCDVESSQAKYFASDTYVQVATDGIQIMGANGYSTEYAMQRHYREAKMFQIFGGTNQIQRNIVARGLKS
ncbi:acyl-CoA dehydrogenase family protein [Paraburkholderia sp. A2WS-5]|uniref:acyl-CoA dehydrogenase family protein n=1 Tax=unclassified Paraburkholderia TaxID=2615204 RepID=UPI003B81E252